MTCEQTFVVPGERMKAVADGYSAGNGCYEIFGFVHAALVGKVVERKKLLQNGKEVKLLEICGHFGEKKYVLPHNNCIVTARVESVGLRAAKCSILCVEDTYLRDEFSAVLKKEDVRLVDKDRAELWKCVQPGDIILARVVGVGDTQTQFLLSIAEPELGVTHAIGQNLERMLPDSDGKAVKHIHSDYREFRKVALVPDLNN